VIPNEAVEAAMDVVLDGGLVLKRSLVHDLIEAAAPHLMAAVFALHEPIQWKPGQPRPAESDTICGSCGTVYPCATVLAIANE